MKYPILKLTTMELEELLRMAKHNEKRGDARRVIQFHPNGVITQLSGYPECNAHQFPLSATVCEGGMDGD